MGIIANDDVKKELSSPKEQTQIIEETIKLIEQSTLTDNKPLFLNFIGDDSDGYCLRISGGFINKRYITGKYEAQVNFLLVYRKMSVTSNEDRLDSINKLNEIGDHLGGLSEINLDSYVINKIIQNEMPKPTYRDDTGIEDVGATFTLEYTKK